MSNQLKIIEIIVNHDIWTMETLYVIYIRRRFLELARGFWSIATQAVP